jgi:hypothetical protein
MQRAQLRRLTVTADEALELVLGWADGTLPHIDSERIEEAAEVVREWLADPEVKRRVSETEVFPIVPHNEPSS